VLLVNSRGKYFSEWGPPHFTTVPCLLLLVLLAAAIVPMLRRGSNSWFEISMIAVICGWSVYSQRTVPVAAALVMPIATANLQTLIGATAPTVRRERVVVLGGAAAVLAVLACVVPSTAGEPPRQPAWVATTLSALLPGTTVLDDELWGGFLMWRYPQLNLAAHGYGDVYTTAELDDMGKIVSLHPGWPTLVARTGAQYALYKPDAPIAYALRQRGWAVVHKSADVELLKAP
jgi:hypothetical protein